MKKGWMLERDWTEWEEERRRSGNPLCDEMMATLVYPSDSSRLISDGRNRKDWKEICGRRSREEIFQKDSASCSPVPLLSHIMQCDNEIVDKRDVADW